MKQQTTLPYEVIEPAWSLTLKQPIHIDYEIENKCPKCGEQIYIYWDTPATDHPELLYYSVECTKCEWHDGDSYPTLRRLAEKFKLRPKLKPQC